MSNHSSEVTCPHCGREYDVHLDWTICPYCGFDRDKDKYRIEGKTTVTITRTREQIDEILDRCRETEESGLSEYPNMTYEEGIRAMFDWLEGGDHPFD